jgi:4-alpha-glucanotransferase
VDALSRADRALLDEVRAAPGVRWNDVRALKGRALDLAFERFVKDEWDGRSERASAFERFRRREASWLEDYALFVAVHDELHDHAWTGWPAGLRDREPAALAEARARLSRRILFREWLQWQLEEQWQTARRTATEVGVELAGDLPFMVATDSADVWSRRGDFRLDARVGVPPDAFSETGQDWGLPVYRWDVMERDGFRWLSERARRMADLYGVFRVDHVVGLYRTYFFPNDGGAPGFVPEGEEAQTRNGERVLSVLSKGARVVAEDLGTVPDFVRASLARIGVPGYRVLRWEREWRQPAQPFRDPLAWPALSVATTGTHDTESLAEWFEAMPEDERGPFLALPQLAEVRERSPGRFDDGVRDAILDLVYRSGSDLLLLPFQDAMGRRERVNVPGTVNEENWTYRTMREVSALHADRASRERLRGLAERSGRIAGG